MAVNLEAFNQPLLACKEIFSAGSKVLLGLLDDCADQPTEFTVEVDAAAAIGDTSLTLALSAPLSATSVKIRRGSVLRFGAQSVKVINEATVTPGGVVVQIEKPLTAALAIGASAKVWGLLQLLSVTNLPLNFETQTEDRTDLETFQTSTVTTNVGAKSSIATIARADDEGFWSYIYTATQSGRDVWLTIVLAEGWLVAGRVKVMNLNTDGNINTIRKPTFDVQFQSRYASPTYYDYLTTEQKVEFNLIRSLSGLSVLP